MSNLDLSLELDESHVVQCASITDYLFWKCRKSKIKKIDPNICPFDNIKSSKIPPYYTIIKSIREEIEKIPLHYILLHYHDLYRYINWSLIGNERKSFSYIIFKDIIGQIYHYQVHLSYIHKFLNKYEWEIVNKIQRKRLTKLKFRRSSTRKDKNSYVSSELKLVKKIDHIIFNLNFLYKQQQLIVKSFHNRVKIYSNNDIIMYPNLNIEDKPELCIYHKKEYNLLELWFKYLSPRYLSLPKMFMETYPKMIQPSKLAHYIGQCKKEDDKIIVLIDIDIIVNNTIGQIVLFLYHFIFNYCSTAKIYLQTLRSSIYHYEICKYLKELGILEYEKLYMDDNYPEFAYYSSGNVNTYSSRKLKINPKHVYLKWQIRRQIAYKYRKPIDLVIGNDWIDFNMFKKYENMTIKTIDMEYFRPKVFGNTGRELDSPIVLECQNRYNPDYSVKYAIWIPWPNNNILKNRQWFMVRDMLLSYGPFANIIEFEKTLKYLDPKLKSKVDKDTYPIIINYINNYPYFVSQFIKDFKQYRMS